MMRRMTSADDVLWATLRQLDDPNRLERPADFDEGQAKARFARLVNLIETAFRCDCNTDAGPLLIQDAAFFGDVMIPGEVTETGQELCVRVSNFGPMATFGSSRGDAADPVDVALADRERVEVALVSAGYFLVPKGVLLSAYDGRAGGSPFLYTWWSRFFDYL